MDISHWLINGRYISSEWTLYHGLINSQGKFLYRFKIQDLFLHFLLSHCHTTHQILCPH